MKVELLVAVSGMGIRQVVVALGMVLDLAYDVVVTGARLWVEFEMGCRGHRQDATWTDQLIG